jgi:two-component system, OmpR family, sensor histidine kinase CiaH
VNSDIFKSASLKLTSLYLIIIMSISLLFSVGFYKVASDEIVRGIRRQPISVRNIIQTRNADVLNEIIDNQNDAILIAKARLQASLLFINLFILIGGGMLSYYLARRTLKPIEDIHEAQSRFTADASHELRTPIAAMRLENEISLADDKLTLKMAKDQLKSNIEELDKLTSLSENLLKLARIDNEGLEKTKTKIEDVVNEAKERVLETTKQKKQIIVMKNIDKGYLMANSESVIEALVTLLDNASKYSPAKSRIIISTKRSMNNVDFSVKDNGIGISDEHQKLVFDRFYRADNSRQKNDVDGYGIGLSIAKAAVESHGGSVSVKSSLGKGSTFTLHFPAK